MTRLALLLALFSGAAAAQPAPDLADWPDIPDYAAMIAGTLPPQPDLHTLYQAAIAGGFFAGSFTDFAYAYSLTGGYSPAVPATPWLDPMESPPCTQDARAPFADLSVWSSPGYVAPDTYLGETAGGETVQYRVIGGCIYLVPPDTP